MARFDGKVAIVTGAASGIGLATALRLADEGAAVLAVDRSPGSDSHARMVWHHGDVTQMADVQAMVDAAMRRWGRLDILVNNAGTGSLGDTEMCAEAEWDRVFAVNIRAIFLCCKAAIPAMASGSDKVGSGRAGGGAIVNVASISGMFGDYAMDAYNASKGAVINYTRSLALSGAKQGIRVNALCPGLVDTPMSGPATADPVDRQFWFDRIPMGRAGRPEELAATIAFLASDDASYMTGAMLVADGGVTAHTGQPDAIDRRRLRAMRQEQEQSQ